jgi:transketolase
VRTAFAARLTELADADDRIVLLTGDLGFTVLEPFAERHPDRFFNAGVAEQNMVGLATGLAEAGFIPFAYSIATFATLRPYEFIRNGPALHRLPVRIVGIGGGIDYGHNGVTHFALEDVGVMRLQPEITTIVPADREQTRAALDAIADLDRPVYLRLGRLGDPVPKLEGRFRVGRLEVLADGGDAALIALGPLAHAALAARDLLERDGIRATVAVVSSFNPSPEEDVRELLAGVPVAATVEGHYRIGGLGSFVAEVVADAGLGTRIARIGVEAMPHGLTGSEDFLAEKLGLTPAAIAASVTEALHRL